MGRLARNIDHAKEKRLAALLECAARPHGGEEAGAGMRCPTAAQTAQSSRARPPAARRGANARPPRTPRSLSEMEHWSRHAERLISWGFVRVRRSANGTG